MRAEAPDVVVLGGGIDALVCATTLAKAGRSVVVASGDGPLGGTLATDDLGGGLRAPATFASVEALAPTIVRELALEKHGLRLSAPGPLSAWAGDGPPLVLPPPASDVSTRTAAAVRDGASPADARAFERFDAFVGRLSAVLSPVFGRPLPPLEPSRLRDWVSVARPAWALRRLGREDLAEVMRFLPMPISDVLDERFDDDRLRVALAIDALRGSWLGPRSPGGSLNLMLHRTGHARGAVGHPRFAVGGPGALADALENAARAAGVEVRAVGVTQVAVRRGRAVGVVLDDGTEIAAKTVVSTLHPRTTLLTLVPSGVLDPDIAFAVRAMRSRGTVGIVRFVVDGLPARDGLDEAAFGGRMVLAADLDAMEQAFDETKYGLLPTRPVLDVTVPTLADPTLTTAGKHVVHVWVQYPPHALRAGDWASHREALGDVVEETLEQAWPGLRSRAERRDVQTPADLEERFGLEGGHLYQLEPALDQVFYLRPLPRFGRYASPLPGLFMGGPGTHGGLGPSGLAGHNAAKVVADSLAADIGMSGKTRIPD